MFTESTFRFLDELASNNNREWFDVNRQRYEDEVREPAFEYIRSMEGHMAAISPHFLVKASKTGGSLMRVFRDTRFGKDKTPYKTNIGIQFRHLAGKDVHAPGFYLHIEPDEMFLAAGIWAPDNPTLTKVRMLIDEYPEEWLAIKKPLLGGRAPFGMHGESLKTAPRGYDADHPLIEDLRRKHFIASRPLAHKDVLGKGAAKRTAGLFERAAPLVKFICEACDLDY